MVRTERVNERGVVGVTETFLCLDYSKGVNFRKNRKVTYIPILSVRTGSRCSGTNRVGWESGRVEGSKYNVVTVEPPEEGERSL